MKKLYFLLMAIMLLASSIVFAQNEIPESNSQGTETSIHKQDVKLCFFGLGVGLPYGWNGVNMEALVHKALYLSFGGGILLDYPNNAKYIGLVYNIGPSIHVRPATEVWQPAFKVLYGINGLLITDDYYGHPPSYRQYRGVTIGLSNKVLFGQDRNSGFAFDILLIASSGVFEHLDEFPKFGERFKVGIGYLYRFQVR